MKKQTKKVFLSSTHETSDRILNVNNHARMAAPALWIPSIRAALLSLFLILFYIVQAQPVGQVTQGLSTLEKGVWPNKTCAVCWENPSQVDATQRLWVQDAVAGTWEKESEFRTTGWGTCNANSRGIRILISNDWPHTEGLGTLLDGKKDGMVLNFNWSGCPAGATAEECIRKVAVHEFGHALGFAHEQNRTDAPLPCQLDATGSVGDWWITPYDANSIMNYCSPTWNNDGLLSDLDKMGVRMLYGGSGYLTDPIFYGTNAKNELLWYKHTGHWNASFEWATNAGNAMGTGWGFKHLFSDGEGHLYGILENGDMYWYNHNGYHEGVKNWSLTSRSIVKKDWNLGNKAVFAAGGGVIYVIKDNGDLFWYKHLGYQDGSSKWDANSGAKVGNGWNDFHAVFSGGNGVIYLIDKKGDLFWYKHAGYTTGAKTWYGGATNKVGNGWLTVKQVFSPGWGHIYAVGSDGALRYYNHMGFINGTNTWKKGTGNKVGSGWSTVKTVGMGSINPTLLGSLITKEVSSDPNILKRN